MESALQRTPPLVIHVTVVAHFKMKIAAIYIIFVIGLFFVGCRENQPEIELIYHSDSKGLFSIGVPNDWHIEKEKTDDSSEILFSDTTKLIEDAIVFIARWDSTKVYLNEHFKTSIDSVAREFGHKPSLGEFYSINDFKAYKFENHFFDTLNQLHFKETNYYFTKSDLKGHLRLSILRTKEELTQMDSTLIESIVQSLTINQIAKE